MFCNDKYLVTFTSGYPGYTHNMKDTPFPPKGTDDMGNSNGCVTRSTTYGFHMFKYPLTPVPLSTASQTNNMGSGKYTGGKSNGGTYQ